MRGEEPVFVVTGRREDVQSAKREIMSAAEHFSQIRAQRKNAGGAGASGAGGGLGVAPNAHIPGNVTTSVRVPYRVVGLVVGPKGATIKRIQQTTSTYIITPSREKEPIFEVTGLPDDVEKARREIEAHIAIRTGGIINGSGSSGTPDEMSSDFSNSSPLFLSGMENSFANNFAFGGQQQLSSGVADFYGVFDPEECEQRQKKNLFGSGTFPAANAAAVAKVDDLYTMFTAKEGGVNGSMPARNRPNNQSYESDEGIGGSPTFDMLSKGSVGVVAPTVNGWPDFSAGNFGSMGSQGTTIEGCGDGGYMRRNSSGINSATNSSSSTPPAIS